MLDENSWGYTRVMGEIKKLGLTLPSLATVKRIMKEHDLDPGPRTDPDSWQEFLKRHAETLYECDFFSKRIWTRWGLKQCYVLVFLHLGRGCCFFSSASTSLPVSFGFSVRMSRTAADMLKLRRHSRPLGLPRSPCGGRHAMRDPLRRWQILGATG